MIVPRGKLRIRRKPADERGLKRARKHERMVLIGKDRDAFSRRRLQSVAAADEEPHRGPQTYRELFG